jgi:hypothetical protein
VFPQSRGFNYSTASAFFRVFRDEHTKLILSGLFESWSSLLVDIIWIALFSFERSCVPETFCCCFASEQLFHFFAKLETLDVFPTEFSRSRTRNKRWACSSGTCAQVVSIVQATAGSDQCPGTLHPLFVTKNSNKLNVCPVGMVSGARFRY